jgi:hypothetical protein
MRQKPFWLHGWHSGPFSSSSSRPVDGLASCDSGSQQSPFALVLAICRLVTVFATFVAAAFELSCGQSGFFTITFTSVSTICHPFEG